MSSSVVQTKRAVWTSGKTCTAEQSTPCATSQARYSREVAADGADEQRRRPSTPSPNAMFAPDPPRRIARSSTRKLSEIRSSWSTTSWSANFPGKCMRWSVAMEPVTAMGTSGDPSGLRSAKPAITAS